MALSEQEEFELLSLERERAMQQRPAPAQADVRRVDNATAPYTAPVQQTPTEALTGAAMSGLRTGSPLMFGASMAGEGMNQGNKFLERGAYDLGGRVTDLTGSPEAGFAANIGLQTIPSLVTGSAAANVTRPVSQAAGKWVMQKAVKPSFATESADDIDRALTAMLEKGINATPGGMAAVRKRVAGLADEVSTIIKNSGEMVSTSEAAKKVERSFNKFRYAMVNREANLKSITDAKDEFLRAVDELDPLSQYSGSIPVQLAQKIKRATQRALSNEFGTLSSAQREAAKDITYGLRTGIEKAEPGVKPINAQIEELMNVLSVAERHALQALNKNPAGLSLLTENPAAAAAFAADRSEAFKSLLARMLYSKALPQATVGGATAAYEGSRNTPRN